ncbi:unnamed protein product, partial [marine sediment metagenome]
YVFVKWFANDKRRKLVAIYAKDKHKVKIARMFLSHPILGFRYCDRKKE